MEDYYEILQVSPNAELEVINAAYRKLALKYHPDTSEHPSSSEQMKKINLAYEILSDPVKKQAYDRQRASAQQTNFRGADRPAERSQPRETSVSPSGGTVQGAVASFGALMALRLMKQKLQRGELSGVRSWLSHLQSDPEFSILAPELQEIYDDIEKALGEVHEEEIDKEIVDLIQGLLARLVRKITTP